MRDNAGPEPATGEPATVAMPSLTFPVRAVAPDAPPGGMLTPHADAHNRGANPVAARVAMPDYRAPVGFANNSWNFASGLPSALRSPPGHLAAVTPNRRWEGSPPKFVPMEVQPKPSRAAHKPPEPLAARQSFTRWGFRAGTYVSDHQPQPQYLGLQVRGLSSHQLLPQPYQETEVRVPGWVLVRACLRAVPYHCVRPPTSPVLCSWAGGSFRRVAP